VVDWEPAVSRAKAQDRPWLNTSLSPDEKKR
jgi:hypothetical protein